MEKKLKNSGKMLEGSTSAISIDTVYEFGAKFLFHAIEWAKNVSFFNELCEKDQVIFQLQLPE